MRSTHLRSDDGASALEFALVMPLLVILVFGIIQFGFLFNQWQQLEHAAREGARWASLRNPTGDVIAVTSAAAPDLGLGPGSVTVSADPTSIAPRSPITVTAQVQVPVFTPVISRFLGAQVNLRARATQRVEG